MYLIGTNATAPTFTPDEETRRWLAQSLQAVIAQLGAPALRPQWFTDTPARGIKTPKDLDGLFDFICAAQEQVGQSDLEFTLIDLQPGQPPVPHGFNPLGDATGHLLHSFARAQEIVLVVAPQLFRVPSLLLGHVARELGRLGLWQQPTTPAVAELDSEAAAELAGIALGMGTWVANGAYIFNNACCGGGCGVDLGSVRAALSLPQACFAVALDARRKNLSRRHAARQLESTQSAAFKANWDACTPQLAALPAATTNGSLRA